MDKTKKRRTTRRRNTRRRNTRRNTRKVGRVFKKADFYSGDGFLTTVWGPAQWHMLHTISFNYPVKPTLKQKKQYRDYILSLQHVLPCGACRKNLVKNLKQLPLTMAHMKDRDSLSRYVYNLHELVNRMLKKKSNLSYCDVRERYEHFRARCTDEKPKEFSMSEMPRTNKTLKARKDKKEKGCTEPLYGKKARCILNIVPQEQKGQSIQIDQKCIKKRD